MSGVEFSLMLGLGLLSSLHCAQMCGPIVVGYSLASLQGANRSNRWASLSSHLAYNAGCILTYCALGAIAGVLGQSVTWMGRLAGLGQVTSLIAGVLMIVGGVAMLGWLPAVGALGQSSGAMTAKFVRPLRGLMTSSSVSSRFALGLVLGMLPCGLIYAALVKSLAAGNMVGGALGMLAFGLGTVVSLLAIGVLSTSFRWTLSRWSSRIAATAVVAMGTVLLWRAGMPLQMPGGHASGCH